MTRVVRRAGLCVPLLVAVATIAACNGENPPVEPPPVPNRPIEVPTAPPTGIATISLLGSGTRNFAVFLGQAKQLSVIARDIDTREVQLPVVPRFISRHPDVISVGSDGMATALTTGTARLVALAELPDGRVLSDSLDVPAACTGEIRGSVAPATVTVAVGETIPMPKVSVKTCSGMRDVIETFSYTTFSGAFLSVDPATGAITGMQPGAGSVAVWGKTYRWVLATVTVNVVPPKNP